MATIQAEIRRGFLRSLYRGAAATATLMSEALDAFQVQGYDALKTGRLVINTSGAGNSVSFRVPQLGSQVSEEQVFALSEQFLQIHADAVAAGADPNDTPAIFAAMLADDRMQSVTRIRSDFSLLRQC